MNIQRLFSIVSLVALGAVASSQALPPPAFAGQSYWYGPGPSAVSVTSTSQDTGGYAEFIDGGATWTVSSGGPAVQNTAAGPTGAAATFYVASVAFVQPYVYIDGYFGVTAYISGFGAGIMDLGSSRFYVVHNTPVEVNVYFLSHFVRVGGGATMPATYTITYTGYTNASYTGTFNILGGAAGITNFSLDPVSDSGIAYIDIGRTADVNTNQLTGPYTASGLVSISAT